MEKGGWKSEPGLNLVAHGWLGRLESQGLAPPSPGVTGH